MTRQPDSVLSLLVAGYGAREIAKMKDMKVRAVRATAGHVSAVKYDADRLRHKNWERAVEGARKTREGNIS